MHNNVSWNIKLPPMVDVILMIIPYIFGKRWPQFFCDVGVEMFCKMEHLIEKKLSGKHIHALLL